MEADAERRPVGVPLAAGATIGIVGGGQLGRMLAMAAARLGYRTIVLDPGAPCPAAQVANEQIVARYDEPEALDDLASRCDVITYEFENVPDSAAARLARLRPLRPNSEALAVSQDRLAEKVFFASIGIPTAPHRPVDSQEDVADALAALDGRAILKTRRLGYDGKGQLRIEGVAPADAFASLGSVPLIAEGVVDFVAEISVIVARGLDGETRCFEPARNEHRDGILASSIVPSGQPEAVTASARQAAIELVTALDYVGVLGLELFVLADGRILANEYAPRVHNSGHWTELSCVTDQFEQHVLAITGHPLGTTGERPCEMINLIGTDVERVPELLAAGDWRVHLYGKLDVRAGRKMGHATRLR